MAQPSIVILDDDRGQPIGAQLRAILAAQGSYRVQLTGRHFIHGNATTDPLPQLIVPVLSESKEHGQRLLSELRAVVSHISLLPVVAPEVVHDVFDDPQVWPTDFLLTPLREAEVRVRVQRLLPPRVRVNSSGDLPDQVSGDGPFAQLVGEDRTFNELRRKIPRTAQFESTVLLTGETGTGKERVARALHYLSRRAHKPFLPVNCGAIPTELFENEIYGHQRGAFTGAQAAHPGLIAEAEGGTLFLDEIETLGIASQVKLLRFLQDQTYYSLGSTQLKRADVWIIASTNVDLLSKVKDGTFREDLFYRLAVITLSLPPLRQRTTDVPLLVAYFLTLHGERPGATPKQFSGSAMKALCDYAWPGNVRELENVVRQSIALTEAPIIQLHDLPIPRQADPAAGRTSFRRDKAKATEEFEKRYVTELMRAHSGNVTHAAREAGKDRRAFGRLVKKYQIAKQ